MPDVLIDPRLAQRIIPRRDVAAEGPMLDGMLASELQRQRALPARPNVAVEGPGLTGMPVSALTVVPDPSGLAAVSGPAPGVASLAPSRGTPVRMTAPPLGRSAGIFTPPNQEYEGLIGMEDILRRAHELERRKEDQRQMDLARGVVGAAR